MDCPDRYTSRNCHPARMRRSRGEAAAAMRSPDVAASDRETFAAPVPAALQNGAAAAGAHALAEPVDLFPAAIVRLERAFH